MNRISDITECEVYQNANKRLRDALITFSLYGIFTDKEMEHYGKRIDARINMGDVGSLKELVVILAPNEVVEIKNRKG